LQPIFKRHDVRLVGVGLEHYGVEEFVEGNFFDGDLYIDDGRKSYDDLGFMRYGYLSLAASLFSKKIVENGKKAVMELNVGGNLLGNGFQNGGVLVVEKGGKTLHHYVQDGPADHEDNTTIMNALGIHEAALHALNAISN